jgi:hypothetical protein
LRETVENSEFVLYYQPKVQRNSGRIAGLDTLRLQMIQAAQQMRNLAERLIAHETRDNKSSGTKSPAVFPVPEKLRPPLAALVGSMGFSALLSRALVLAGPDVAWLRAVHVKADGSLEGPADLEAQVAPEKIIEGRVALLARLLGLLMALIGENLTMQLIRDVWPKLILNDLNFGNGDGDEKEKRPDQAQTAEKSREPTG